MQTQIAHTISLSFSLTHQARRPWKQCATKRESKSLLRLLLFLSLSFSGFIHGLFIPFPKTGGKIEKASKPTFLSPGNLYRFYTLQRPKMSENENDVLLKDIYELLKKEVENPALQEIEPDTYQKVATTLGSLKGQGFDGIEAKIRDRLVELLSTSAKLLFEMRQDKIVMNAARDVELLDYSRLTDEEKYVLDGQQESADRRSEVVAATAKGRPKVLEAISARLREKRIVVRFVKAQEQFVGIDMTKYGPFQQEDVATLPLENARSFINTGVAVQVHARL
jgi:DNA replication factor GINS